MSRSLLRFHAMRVNEAVGQFLRNYREGHGLTMDDVANASQRYGSNWSSGTISQMEHGGSKADSLPVLILLVQSLNDLTGDNMTLADVFMWADSYDVKSFDITDIVKLAPIDMHDTLSDQRLNLANHADRATGRRRMNLERLNAQEGATANPSEEDYFEYFCSIVPTFAEKRAALKADISPEVFAAFCLKLYGHSLDEEAKQRAGEGASPQKRGRETRILRGEVAAAIKSFMSRKDKPDQSK